MAALLAGFVFSSTIQAQTSLAQEHFERAVGYHLSRNNEAEGRDYWKDRSRQRVEL